MKLRTRFLAMLLAALMVMAMLPAAALADGTGWQKIDGTWYWYDETGEPARNEWRDGCWLGPDGAWTYQARGAWHKSGSGWWFGDSSGWYARNKWQKIDGSWYFFDGNGYMLRNQWHNGCRLNGSGAWDESVTGAWVKDGIGWRYGDESQDRYESGWVRIDSRWYCFGDGGYMYASEWHDGYYFGSSGAWTYEPRGGWEQDSAGYRYGDTSGWYARNNWQKIDGIWYYFDENGYMLSDTVWNGYCFYAGGGWNGLRIGDGWASITFADGTETVYGIDLDLASEHNYYPNETWAQAMQGDAFAKYYADVIMADESLTTDLDRVTAAARVVSGFCGRAEYGNDADRHYRSPYGVFVVGIYTCAGATRALGRILDYMDFQWTHRNENDYTHQWCELYMDGQLGMADGQAGIAAYGDAEEAYAANGIIHF